MGCGMWSYFYVVGSFTFVLIELYSLFLYFPVRKRMYAAETVANKDKSSLFKHRI